MTDELYLQHHGIKGMKWGVRRFQNPDGTLTDAGKKRYGTSNVSEAYAKDAKALDKGVSGAQTVVSGAQKISDLSNSQPRNRYDKRDVLTQEEIDKMSNKELQELVTRLNLEQQYSILTQDRASQSKLKTGLEYTNAILSMVGGALTIAAAYKALKG